jgi:hypothetical protein
MTAKKKELFLEEVKKDANVTRSAEAINVSRTCLYEHKRDDEEFSEAWDKAVEVGEVALIENLERECDRRAVEGVDKPVYQQGQMVGYVRHYSDSLLMFRLKKLDPRYAKQVIAGDKEQPLVLELTTE